MIIVNMSAMTKPTAQEILSLRMRQLSRLNMLLDIFKNYQDKRENILLYLFDSRSEADALKIFLGYNRKELAINDLFSMDETNTFATVMKIYTAMKASFQMKTFSYSNLFYKASEQMQDGNLSSDAVVRIIRLIDYVRDRFFSMYCRAETGFRANALKTQASAPATGTTYRSYQQETDGSRVRKQGVFALQYVPEDGDMFTEFMAEQAGYTKINEVN